MSLAITGGGAGERGGDGRPGRTRRRGRAPGGRRPARGGPAGSGPGPGRRPRRTPRTAAGRACPACGLHPGPPDDGVLGQVQPHLGDERDRHQPEPVQAGARARGSRRSSSVSASAAAPRHRRKHAPAAVGRARPGIRAPRHEFGNTYGTSASGSGFGPLLSEQVRAIIGQRPRVSRFGTGRDAWQPARLSGSTRKRASASSSRTAEGRTCSSTTPPSPSSGYRELNEGQKVEFEVTQGQKGPQADNVRPM